MARDPIVTIRRILKVNHAGESGAVRIYGAQLAVARLLYRDIVPALEGMRQDEIEHRKLFRDAMPARRTMPCRVMRLWTLGGFVLGFVTALLGRNMIWICTEAVEATVHRHLRRQLEYLDRRDPELFALIAAIEEEELDHLRSAEARQTRRRGPIGSVAFAAIGFATATMIWLSTWGDPTPMQRDLRSR